MGEIIGANKKLNFMPSEVNNFYSRNTDIAMNIDESRNFNIEAVEHSFVKDEIKSFEYDTGCCHADSVTALVPKLKKLQLSSETKGDNSKQLAGYIKAIIPPTGTVVIQLASEDKILDIGTTIFGEKKNGQVRHYTKEYQEIGFITDIFGPVHEPMYALQLKEKAIGDSLKINSKVFYFCDHPTTRYVSVEHEVENKYTVIQGRRS